MTRWLLRLRASIQVMLVLLIAAAGPAIAKDEDGGSSAFMDIFGVKNTDGVSLSQQPLALTTEYELFGKDLPDPFLMMLNVGWSFYRILTGFALWVLGQAQKGTWRTAIVDAVDGTVTPFFSSLHQLELPVIAGTAGFILVGWAFVRGRVGASLGEAGMIAVVCALAMGIFATPVGSFTEPDGAMDKAFDSARGLTSEMGEGESDDGVERSQERMADILISNPAQLLSFGELLSQECKEKLVKAQKDDPDDAEKQRKAVSKCDDQHEEQMPLEAVMGLGLFIWPFLATTTLAMVLLSALLMFLVMLLIWLSIEVAWNALFAPFPGAARMKLVNSLIKAGIALVALVVVLVIAAAASQLLVEIFDGVRGDDGSSLLDTLTAYAIASAVMTLLWIVLWWKVLAMLLKSRRGASKVKDGVTPSRPTQMPPSRMEPIRRIAAPVAQHAAGSALGRGIGNAGGGNPNPTHTPRPVPQPGPTQQPGPVPQPGPREQPGPIPQPGPKPPSMQLAGGGRTGAVKKGVIKVGANVATKAALGAATGGTSTIAGFAASSGAKHMASAGAKRAAASGARHMTQGATKAASSVNNAGQAARLGSSASGAAGRGSYPTSVAGVRQVNAASRGGYTHTVGAVRQVHPGAASRDSGRYANRAAGADQLQRPGPARPATSTADAAAAAREMQSRSTRTTDTTRPTPTPERNQPTPRPRAPYVAGERPLPILRSEPMPRRDTEQEETAQRAQRMRERLYGDAGPASPPPVRIPKKLVNR